MALRVLFDTNAYDAILAAGDAGRISALTAAGKLVVVTTQVQEDEIRQIRDRKRQRALLAVSHAIGGNRVEPTDLIGGEISHMTRDDILARVALASCDLLITEDRALASRCTSAIGYAEFAKRAGLGK